MKVLLTTYYYGEYTLYEVESVEKLEELKTYWKASFKGENPKLPEGVEELGTHDDLMIEDIRDSVDYQFYCEDIEEESEQEEMKNYLFFSTMNQDLSFVLGFKEEDAEKAVRLAQEGFYAWNTNGEYPDEYEHFTEEDQERIEDAGYMDLSIELLDDAGIEYVELDWLDDSGEILPEHETDVTQIDCSIFE